jgi:hypothetical protein
MAAPDPIFDIPALERFGIETGIFAMMNSKWGWPIAESIHFTGLCLLMAAVGMFDLRMLGVAKGVSMTALHRMVPIGVLGWLMCVVTGVLFFLTAPGQYLYNPAWQTKMALMGIAGVNMVVFYLVAAKAMQATGPDDDAPWQVKVFAAVSLACWLGVIIGGRWITFFRPPYHWCVWCGG